MEEGTFVTGVELIGNTPALAPIENKSRQEIPTSSALKTSSSNKPNRSGTAANRTLQPLKTEGFPSIVNSKEAQSTKSALRNSLTESTFKKPLFQKIANVRDTYEKNKSPENSSKLRSSTSAAQHKPLNHWKKDEVDVKNYTHADAFNTKIVQKFDELYRTKRGFADVNTENLAKRKHFFDEVEKQENKLQSELKKYNNTAYEIQRKEELLASLQKQNGELIKKFEDNSTLEQQKQEKQKELEHWEEQIEIVEHYKESLTHMKHLKKELLLNIRKNYQKRKEAFDAQMENIDAENKRTEYEKTLISKKQYEAKGLKKKAAAKDDAIDPEFEDLLQSEVSEFEERRNIREILKHEKVIEEEIRQQEAEEARRIQQARENRIRDEENKRLQKEAAHERELNNIKKIFNEFQKVTNVSRKEQLLQYYDGLEERGEVLEKEIDTVSEDIKAKKEELKELKKQLKFKKFEETLAPKDRFPSDIRLDDLEVLLREKLNDANERETHIKRLEKLSYEVCTVISRILKQLQKSKTPMAVDKNNVAELLSICGLKLERMLTVVIKKKKTFFIESINTDGTIKEGPPEYMNIVSDDVFHKSKKRIEKEGAFDLGEELEDEFLTNFKGQLKNKYEEVEN